MEERLLAGDRGVSVLPMPKEHPPPSPTTVKQLYGTASFCAFPGCREPLFRSGVDGRPVLNSNVCHIKARREGGRRWDPEQSAEENFSFENLVLLCLRHHPEVDDPERLEQFSVETLLGWKSRQLEQGGGFGLNDEHAAWIASGIDARGAGGGGGGGGGAPLLPHILRMVEMMGLMPAEAARAIGVQLNDPAVLYGSKGGDGGKGGDDSDGNRGGGGGKGGGGKP